VRILVVGGGGREHALCHALRRENPDAVLHAAPGNPGTAALADNLPIAPDDVDRLADAADMLGIDMVVVGPEAPLAAGLADRLRAEGRAVVGPNAAAAQLEASKAFAKEVMAAAGVPTAASATFTDLRPALAYVEAHAEPLVVKASGLAAGKGAIVCATRAEAAAAVRAMLAEGKFGDAGRVVVIEAFLQGEELSVLALTNGTDVELLPAAQDHKRLLEGDRGPNTGGMGAYSPVALATPELLDRAAREICLPVLEELSRRGTPFSGVLYAGLMVDPAGVLAVVEFNCRLGDPEAQVVLPLVEAGLTEAFWRIARGDAPSRIRIAPGAAVTTVLAARGYPDQPERGAAIDVPSDLPAGVVVYHGGTTRGAGAALRVAGGRVLTVTGVAADFVEAQQLSREAAERITFEGRQFRRDIGWRQAARLQTPRVMASPGSPLPPPGC
jgi:phosphoribosylamine--glycine ligase